MPVLAVEGRRLRYRNTLYISKHSLPSVQQSVALVREDVTSRVSTQRGQRSGIFTVDHRRNQMWRRSVIWAPVLRDGSSPNGQRSVHFYFLLSVANNLTCVIPFPNCRFLIIRSILAIVTQMNLVSFTKIHWV